MTRHAPAVSWIDGDKAVVTTTRGIPVRIPTTRIPSMLGDAKKADDGRAMFALRWFDRDALQGAYDLLPTCDQCHEAPAFEDMGDGKTFCAGCCSSAAGSHYDDKESWA